MLYVDCLRVRAVRRVLRPAGASGLAGGLAGACGLASASGLDAAAPLRVCRRTTTANLSPFSLRSIASTGALAGALSAAALCRARSCFSCCCCCSRSDRIDEYTFERSIRNRSRPSFLSASSLSKSSCPQQALPATYLAQRPRRYRFHRDLRCVRGCVGLLGGCGGSRRFFGESHRVIKQSRVMPDAVSTADLVWTGSPGCTAVRRCFQEATSAATFPLAGRLTLSARWITLGWAAKPVIGRCGCVML
ncbi:uncharacterized protein V1510DRAFT_103437 [Dipodascopsis tothii]|uniref:uncharacterized protein n=1 Tax=Dipodascopsis tothii TaxID=44089 RepID=UPI0034CE3EDA